VYKSRIESIEEGKYPYYPFVPLFYYRVGSDYILVYTWSYCESHFLAVLYHLDLRHNFLLKTYVGYPWRKMDIVKDILKERYKLREKPLSPANLINTSIRDISFFIPLKNKNNIEKVLRVISEVKEICKTVNRATMSNCYNPILEELSNSSISFDPYILGHPWEFRVLRDSKVVDEGAIA